MSEIINQHPYDEHVTNADRNESIVTYPSKPLRDFYGFIEDDAKVKAIAESAAITRMQREAFLRGAAFVRYTLAAKPITP